jgi:hypothetical protein
MGERRLIREAAEKIGEMGWMREAAGRYYLTEFAI